ncbi:MAG: hypothetical protein QOJ95_3615 [Mycobacterium sp.]|nr:hypothetical protein [Mycobacterium sp.]
MTELPDLEALARQLAAILGPLATAAAGFASVSDGEPSKCQQVWCPLCAAVALASGEQHPLVTLVAEHASTLVTLLNAMAAPDEPTPTDGALNDVGSASPPGHYQPIPVTIQD